jgi:hypothetical protein
MVDSGVYVLDGKMIVAQTEVHEFYYPRILLFIILRMAAFIINISCDYTLFQIKLSRLVKDSELRLFFYGDIELSKKTNLYVEHIDNRYCISFTRPLTGRSIKNTADFKYSFDINCANSQHLIQGKITVKRFVIFHLLFFLGVLIFIVASRDISAYIFSISAIIFLIAYLGIEYKIFKKKIVALFDNLCENN